MPEYVADAEFSMSFSAFHVVPPVQFHPTPGNMFTENSNEPDSSETTSTRRRRGRPRGRTPQGAAARLSLYNTAIELIAERGYEGRHCEEWRTERASALVFSTATFRASVRSSLRYTTNSLPNMPLVQRK